MRPATDIASAYSPDTTRIVPSKPAVSAMVSGRPVSAPVQSPQSEERPNPSNVVEPSATRIRASNPGLGSRPARPASGGGRHTTPRWTPRRRGPRPPPVNGHPTERDQRVSGDRETQRPRPAGERIHELQPYEPEQQDRGRPGAPSLRAGPRRLGPGLWRTPI